MSSIVKLALLIVIVFQLFCIYAQSNYHIAPYPSNWFEASEYCHRKGMRMAIVDSPSKQNAIVAEARASRLDPLEFRVGIWIGATDLGRNGTFIWHYTGERVRFARWMEGEPSGGGEHCALMLYWPERRFNWTWNDGHCHTPLYTVCENYEKISCITEFK